MKDALSSGLNRPELRKSASTTAAISCAIFCPEKLVIAIGNGSTLPLVISISTSAWAEEMLITRAAKNPLIQTAKNLKREKVSPPQVLVILFIPLSPADFDIIFLNSMRVIKLSSCSKHLAWIEIHDHFCPCLIFLCR